MAWPLLALELPAVFDEIAGAFWTGRAAAGYRGRRRPAPGHVALATAADLLAIDRVGPTAGRSWPPSSVVCRPGSSIETVPSVSVSGNGSSIARVDRAAAVKTSDLCVQAVSTWLVIAGRQAESGQFCDQLIQAGMVCGSGL
jgi:hypothetical protein